MDKGSLTYLKLQPTAGCELTVADSKEILSTLNDLSNRRSKLITKSSSKRGIEFYLASQKESIDPLKHHIYSICPELVLNEVKQSFVEVSKPSASFSLKFKKHFAYPLYNPNKADDQALFKLLSKLNKLKNSEQIVISLSQVGSLPLRARFIRRRLLNGYRPYLNNKTFSGYLKKLLFLAFYLLSSILKSLVMLISNLATRPNHHIKPSRPKVESEESLMLLDKLYEPLFKTSLSIDIKASNKRLSVIKKEVELAFRDFASQVGDQQLIAKNPKRRDLYSLSDLASMIHFTDSDLKSGVFDVQQFKTLPTPNAFSSKKQSGDVVLGVNTFQGSMKPLILPRPARYRHSYIIGATGSGKSTLLNNLISQDILSGQGATLIDPHGDLALEVVKNIPKQRRQDVIYFDPSYAQTSLAINLLETKASPGSEGYLIEVELLTEGIISLFRKVFLVEDQASHRLEYILRNSIRTAISIPGSNIFTIFKLLTDSSYRLDVVNNLTDQHLINFWRNEIGRAGEYQRIKMTAGVTSKIGRFLFSEPTKRVFGQTKSNLDLRDVLDNNKILICNFSKGNLGEDGSKLFATAILTKIQLAALSRSNISKSDRIDHFVYIDEFQNYAPSILIQMLSELRKYGVYLTMAEQSPSQQDSLSTNVILANVGNLICFRTASPKDAHLLLPSFSDYLTTSDFSNLPAYNFYLKSVGEIVSPPTSGVTSLPKKREITLPDTSRQTMTKLGQLVNAKAI